MKRVAITTLVLTLVLTCFAALLVPIEPETCPQLSADLFHDPGDALMQQETLALCVGQMITAQRAKSARPPPTSPPHAQVTHAPPPPAPPKRDDELSPEQLALIARLRAVACPRVGPEQAAHALQVANGDAYFSLPRYCPECRYKRQPPRVVFDALGAEYCNDEHPSQACDLRMALLPSPVVTVSSTDASSLFNCR